MNNEKLDLLLKRQAQLKESLRAEKERRKAIELEQRERLIRILGRALLTSAEESKDFELMLKGVLRTTALNRSDAAFLQSRNWL
ncbi:MAG TPA: hypothetical protein VKU01_05565 [Bryobacteraceae bacterium]|nr:hypothetical protein [Bryobacteraceae bacterium]